MRCTACGTENDLGRKFCHECGSALGRPCPACGTGNAPSAKFCGECGASLGVTPSRDPDILTSVPPQPPTAERRLVSVMFADLVGFTTLSEHRDAEEVRELLTRYFDTSRTLVGRYGGTIEKFIGDAVMAVWGAPVAREDDAERAVRAALDLTAAVATLGESVGTPHLRARAGVMTGEAAVTLGAEGQGMVAGDLVNTASRIQAATQPGEVFVGESTRRATEAAIEYENVGVHHLKGRAEPVALWRARRVVAGAGGALRSSHLEAPFVGRESELRLIKELFHASATEGRAQLVSIVGIAGIGKSRLSWEFEKYVDGLAEASWWHRGRCLSYGDGVSYWALGEMVKMRCGILDDDEPEVASTKLRATIAEHVESPEDRQWIEPRLAHLLGLEEGMAGDEENLFSAWRILFERLAEKSPTIMVFEDMQWADTGLLDFIEYLLEWTRNKPLYILTLARPELADRRPGWGAGHRNFTSLFLEPLSDSAMAELLRGLVPGLPDDIRKRILQRAEGVPLYAVETVRMLLDRGHLVREDGAFRPSGPIDSLEVPETLHALISARLDGLSPLERRIVQDGAVLGKTFAKAGIRALGGLSDGETDAVLASLVRKEILSVQADPRSPERGQYGFLQDIVKKVAYETLSKRERKAKQLATAAYLEAAYGPDDDEVVEVLASHYLEAYRESPDAPDADTIRLQARTMLVRAGERAASLAATLEAQRAFERAADLTDEPAVTAELLERAGSMAFAGARFTEAADRFARSEALFRAAGETHAAVRVSARLCEVEWSHGRLEQAVVQMDAALAVLSEEAPDEDVAWLGAQLGRFMFFAGDAAAALQRIESALQIAEDLHLPEVLSQALNTKALILHTRGRQHEAQLLLRSALEVALEHDRPSAALRAYNNLADLRSSADRYTEAADLLESALKLARKVGNRYWEWLALGAVYPLFALGRWDEVLARRAEVVEVLWTARTAWAQGYVSCSCAVMVHRGDVDAAERLLEQARELQHSDDVQEQAEYACGRAVVLLGRNDVRGALEAAEVAVARRHTLGLGHTDVKEALVTAADAALRIGDDDRVQSLLALVEAQPAGRRSPFLHAQVMRFRARLAALRGDPAGAERGFVAAVDKFHDIRSTFWHAVTQLEYGEWLTSAGQPEDAAAALSEARQAFTQLAAHPWLERLQRAESAAATVAVDGRAVSGGGFAAD